MCVIVRVIDDFRVYSYLPPGAGDLNKVVFDRATEIVVCQFLDILLHTIHLVEILCLLAMDQIIFN